MIIDNKLTILKSYLSEGRLTNGGVKTFINQTAVSTSEQNNFDLELDDATPNSQDSYNKKKEEHKESKQETEEKEIKKTLSESENKIKILKLLNLI